MIQIRVGKQKKKEKKKIYTENKIGRYVQFLIEREDFLELVASWLVSVGVFSRVEIWSKERYLENNDFDDMDEIAEHMAELGIGI